MLRGIMKVFLIGMPASGKTTVGKRLARLIKARFVDLDAAVVAAAGTPLKQIFKTEGEWGFRVREATALLDVVRQRGDVVVATGGGAPTFGDNLAVMKHAGQVCYLRASVAALARRPGLLTRPILAAHPGGPAKGLAALFRLRRPHYEQADLTIDAEAATPAAIARAIADTVHEFAHGAERGHPHGHDHDD